MQRYWEAVIEPLLSVFEPSVLVEVGAQHGELTDTLLHFIRDREAVLHCIDPAPEFDVAVREAAFGERFVFHRALSLNVLGGIRQPDVVLIDGDYSWYTVFNELTLLIAAPKADIESDTPHVMV